MTDKKPTYIEGVGWRYEVEHSMLGRMHGHDYQGRCIYMLTLTTTDRMPLLGRLSYPVGKPEEAEIEPSALGREVLRCWQEIPSHYPEVKLLAFQLMPDHVHGLLFVTKEQTAHLGQMVKGFKIGCSRAYWAQSGAEGRPAAGAGLGPAGLGSANYNSPHRTAPRRSLFSPGYQDSVLSGKDQLERMFRYIADNPRRLAVKHEHPDLFRVVRQLTVQSTTFAAIGNRWLLDRPVRMQVRCHNNTTEENLRLIARQKSYCLERGRREGAVIVSPCISAGEKEIARAALDAGVPLVVILENGFPPMYKPPGKYFEACANGLLLMLAPWPYHMEKRKITRQQCLALNDIARALSNYTPTGY